MRYALEGKRNLAEPVKIKHDNPNESGHKAWAQEVNPSMNFDDFIRAAQNVHAIDKDFVNSIERSL